MTKEQRLELLKQIEKDIYVPSLESTFLEDAKSCAIHSAIEELEQEPCEDCINREEVCDYIAEFVNHEYATDREREMVKHIIGGIQHLSSVQSKPIEGDAISRKEVLDLVEDMTDQFGVGHRVITEGVISMLPPVTPKPKTGHWTCDRANVRCSSCGKGYKDFYGKANIMSYKFCPNCGAKMLQTDSEKE